MKKFSITVDAIVSTGDLHYMEDFVSEYTDPSVIAQAVDGVPEDEIERAYNEFVVQEFLRESILRGRLREEKLENIVTEMN